MTTNLGKYSVGEPMTISGAGYTPGGSVTVAIERPDHAVDSFSPPRGGTFSFVYAPPGIPGRYKITATDGTYSAKTAATQADALGKDFSQCANHTLADGLPLLGTCDWINGILQKSNSVIVEGMSTLSAADVRSSPSPAAPGANPNHHVLTFHVDASKAGSHAYDFITTYEAAVDATHAIIPPGTLNPTQPDLLPQLFKLNSHAAALRLVRVSRIRGLTRGRSSNVSRTASNRFSARTSRQRRWISPTLTRVDRQGYGRFSRAEVPRL